MKRIIVFVACMGLVAACGGSAGEETTTTGAAPTTTQGETPTTTEGEATTTTEDGVAARVAVAQEVAGEYEGTWNNTTFGSSGAAEAEIELEGTVVTVTLVLGGNVFGGSAPDPVEFVFDLVQEPPYETTSDLFGETTISFEEGDVIGLTSDGIPSLGGMSLVVAGTITATEIDMTYSIFGTDASLFALGTVTMPRN